MKLTLRQFKGLLYFSFLGTHMLYLPKMSLRHLDHNGWMGIVLAAIIGLLIVSLIPISLFKLDTSPIAVQIVIYLTVMIFSLGQAIKELMMLSQFITFHYLMGTPTHLMMAVLLVAVFLLGRQTLEHVGRTVEVLKFYPTFMMILIFLMTINHIELEAFQPVYIKNPIDLVKGSGLFYLAVFADSLLTLRLGQYVKEQEKIKTVYLQTVLKVTAIYLVTTIVTVIFLGVDLTKISTYPFFHMLMNVHWLKIIERVEILFSLFIIVTSVIKLVIWLFLISSSHSTPLKKEWQWAIHSVILGAIYFVTTRVLLAPLELYQWLYSDGAWLLLISTVILVLAYQLSRIKSKK